MGSAIKDVPEEVRMHLKLIFAALVIVAAPVYAQAQKPTRADAQKVFEILVATRASSRPFAISGSSVTKWRRPTRKKISRNARS